MPANTRRKVPLDSPQGVSLESLGRDVERLAGVLSGVSAMALSAPLVVIPERGRWSVTVYPRGGDNAGSAFGSMFLSVTRNGTQIWTMGTDSGQSITAFAPLAAGLFVLEAGDVLHVSVSAVLGGAGGTLAAMVGDNPATLLVRRED